MSVPDSSNNPYDHCSSQWRHNGRDSASNHQPHDCLLNRLFSRRSKKTSKFRVNGLCAGNSPGTGEFPAQMASYAENVSIWWRHHGLFSLCNNCSKESICIYVNVMITSSEKIFSGLCAPNIQDISWDIRVVLLWFLIDHMIIYLVDPWDLYYIFFRVVALILSTFHGCPWSRMAILKDTQVRIDR